MECIQFLHSREQLPIIKASAEVEIIDGHVIPEFGTNRSNDTCSSNCINHCGHRKDQNSV